MNLALVLRDGAARLCAVAEGRALDLAVLAADRGVADPAFVDLAAALAGGRETQRRLADLVETVIDDEERWFPLEPRALRAPFVPSAKILCHVVNYAEHGSEAAITPPERPFFFLKPGSSVTGPYDPIGAHPDSNELDYEVELAAVIGRAGRDIPAERAYDHIAGYVVLNDVSYRDLQFNRDAPGLSSRYGQNWIQGKGLDSSCPFGPWITLTSEISEPYPLRIRCWVDGELRQDATTDQQIFQLPALVECISTGMTLHPGDVIATGTPAGSAIGDGSYLRAGQTVRCEIEKLGALVNEVGIR